MGERPLYFESELCVERRTTELEEQLTTVRHNEQQLNAKLVG